MEQHIGERVGLVERDLSQVKVEQARQGTELTAMRGQLGDVAIGVRKLVEGDARRGPPVSVVTVLATLGSIGAAAGVVWWLIGTAPAVVDLARRMDRLDDPQVGRVPALEQKVNTLTGWQPVAIMKGR